MDALHRCHRFARRVIRPAADDHRREPVALLEIRQRERLLQRLARRCRCELHQRVRAKPLGGAAVQACRDELERALVAAEAAENRRRRDACLIGIVDLAQSGQRCIRVVTRQTFVERAHEIRRARSAQLTREAHRRRGVELEIAFDDDLELLSLRRALR